MNLETSASLQKFQARLQFTGTGTEYFRIWIVNLCFTLLTLGLYFPWAKIRKMRWFAQHTHLLNDNFDYHGRPLPILIGYLSAAVLLFFYRQVFAWTQLTAIFIVILFLIVGPLLLAGAWRFRLNNTSWRGLRFSFHSSRKEIYKACLPLVCLWFVIPLTVSFYGPAETTDFQPEILLTVIGFTMLAWPWAHARFKSLQHNNAYYGDWRFTFESAYWHFYKLYTIFFIGLIALIIGTTILFYSSNALFFHEKLAVIPSGFIVLSILIPFLLFTALSAFYGVQLQRIIWSHTFCRGLHWRNEMRAWPWLILNLRNLLLVTLSLGLYWPFAAVAVARYYVQSIVIESEHPFEEIIAHPTQEKNVNATGDAAIDLLGLDLG